MGTFVTCKNRFIDNLVVFWVVFFAILGLIIYVVGGLALLKLSVKYLTFY